MVTLADEKEPKVPTVSRVREAIAAPLERVPRTALYLSTAAVAGSFAPQPAAAVVAAFVTMAVWDLARRK